MYDCANFQQIGQRSCVLLTSLFLFAACPGTFEGEDLLSWEEITNNTQPLRSASGLISGVTYDNLCVTFQVKDGLAIFQGDMVLGEAANIENGCADDASAQTYGLVVSSRRARWPNGVVPFSFDADLLESTRQEVREAMDHWQAMTSIRFVERTPANQDSYPDWVAVHNHEDMCMANLGREGGKQGIWLTEGCDTNAAIHELGHSVGLHHEHARADRNTYIQINRENIKDGLDYAFDQFISDGDDIGPYDYQSLMHYREKAFSKNGEPTIVALQELPYSIGSMGALTEGDIAAVKSMYSTSDSGAGGGGGSAHDPVGALDSVTDGLARGWACDQDSSANPIQVHIYVGGPAGSGFAGYVAAANMTSEATVNSACGGGNAHRFEFQIPSWQQVLDRPVYAYGINTGGGKNALLSGSPRHVMDSSPGGGDTGGGDTGGSDTGGGDTGGGDTGGGAISQGHRPIGALDGLTGDELRGWTCDKDHPTKSIQVHIYIGGAWDSGAPGYTAVANLASESAVNSKCGGGNAHRFSFKIPDMAGSSGKQVYAYGIDTTGDSNFLLNGAPKTIPGGGGGGGSGNDEGPISSGNRPLGVLDSVAGGEARGWACDRDYPTKSIQVHIYIGGPAGSGAPGQAIVANKTSEAAVNSQCGGGSAHRFSFKIPDAAGFAGKLVYAYGIDATGDANFQLNGAPQTL